MTARQTVTCLGIGQFLTRDIISYTATNTVTNILTALLAMQETERITLGGVDTVLNKTITVDSAWLSAENRNIWEMCKLIQTIVGGYLQILRNDDGDLELWLKASIGVQNLLELNPFKNLIRYNQIKDYQSSCNRLYALGNGINLEKAFSRINGNIYTEGSTYVFMELPTEYAAYKGWTGDGNACPVTVTVEKPTGEWILPTGHEPSGQWEYPQNAYDGTSASAQYYPTSYEVFTDYLHLTLPATTVTQIRFPSWYIQTSVGAGFPHQIVVEIYYGGSWHTIYNDAPYRETKGTLITTTFSAQEITAVRISYKSTYIPGWGDVFWSEWITRVASIELWDTTGWYDDTANWLQGENEKTIKIPIGSYTAGIGYVISYTHAPYIIDLDDIDGDRSKIISCQKTFTTNNQDTLLEMARTELKNLPKLASTATTYDIQYVDLSGDEGLEMEEAGVGSTVRVVDDELGIDVSLPIVRMVRPDISQWGLCEVEVGNKVETILDLI